MLVSLLAGGTISGAVHVARAAVRPLVNLGFMGPPLSIVEDATSAVLSFAAMLAPIVVPFLLVLIVLGAIVLWERRRVRRYDRI